MKEPVPPSLYNRDYFEVGSVIGISGYMNYSWMAELTLRMTHYMIGHLPIERGHVVLDYGCAKGFVVKALRILDIEAYGVDVSEYAIEHLDGEIRDYCKLVSGCSDKNLFERDYDWMIAKDVLEHLTEDEIRQLLKEGCSRVGRMFTTIPLAADDESGCFIVPEYDKDITHVTAKTHEWWTNLFEEMGWHVEKMSTSFPGCKENWTEKWKDGNGFFVIKSAD